MNGSGIKELVIAKLEEKSSFLTPTNTSSPILVTGDNISELKPIYDYIDTHIAEAANEILRIAPLNHLLPKKVENPSAVKSTDDEKIGTITVPEDYLRLYTLKMKDWSRPVHEAISKNHPNYTNQYNKYTRGIAEKPVVVYSGCGEGGYLSYYSVYTSHDVSEFSYVQCFDLDNEYTDKVAEAIALNTAKKVMEVFGNADGITIMHNELTSVLENMKL